MALQSFCYVLVVFLSTINLSKCFPDGAPTSACDTMTPQHDEYSSQTTPNNYSISLSANTVQAGDTITVTFKADSDNIYRGILLKALSTASTTGAAGSFSIRDRDLLFYHTLNCSDILESAITHNSNRDKANLTVSWTAPDTNGNYVFIATVVEEYSTFWAAENGVKSESVEVTGGLTPIPPPQPPPFDYDLCSVDRSCMGYPTADCVSSKSCSMLLTFRPTPDEESESISFELTSSLNGYAAIGLSNDEFMGDDSVLECMASTPVTMYASVNHGYNNYKANSESQQDAFILDEGTFIDGVLTCKFRRNVITTVASDSYEITTNLENQTYFILLAYGKMTGDETNIAEHNGHISTDVTINLTSYDFIVPASGKTSLPIEIIMHGSLMVVSWIALSSIAVFLARYYKDMWPEKTLCAVKLWFAFHRGLNVANVLVTLVAFCIILVYTLKNDAFKQDAHPITGLITIILVVLQPIGAFFRPHPGTPKRVIFNWLHFLGGMLACCFGVITIYLAVRLKQSHLPTYFYYIVTGFVVFYLLMFCCMELLILRNERKKLLEKADIPMKIANGDEPKDEPSQIVKDIVKPQKIHFYKKVLLGLFVCGVVGFAIAMISVIAIS